MTLCLLHLTQAVVCDPDRLQPQISLGLEVNASPGLEDIEAATQVDVGGEIVEYIERRVRKRKRAQG